MSNYKGISLTIADTIPITSNWDHPYTFVDPSGRQPTKNDLERLLDDLYFVILANYVVTLSNDIGNSSLRTPLIIELMDNIKKCADRNHPTTHDPAVPKELYTLGYDALMTIANRDYEAKAYPTTVILQLADWYKLNVGDRGLATLLTHSSIVYQMQYLKGNGFIDTTITNACLYVPEVSFVNTTPGGDPDNPHMQEVCTYIRLETIPVPEMILRRTVERESFFAKDYLMSLLSVSNFSSETRTFDHVIGIVGSFAFDNNRYVMKYNGSVEEKKYTIRDICRCLLTVDGLSGFRSTPKPINYDSVQNFFETICKLIEKGYLDPHIIDRGLFADLLSFLKGSYVLKTRVGQDIINYFEKPVERISAQEAFSFEESQLASFFIVSGMEALDDEVPEDQAGNPESEQSAELSSTKQSIDPKKLTIALSDPGSETLPDYLYRRMVGNMIDAIINSPPSSMKKSDVILLKRWRSLWHNLVSVGTLRDFVSRLSVRLTDVVQ